MPEPGPIVGESPIRKEGLAKVTGRAQYVDDITLPGMWYGATVRSTIARGRIASITFSLSVDWSQFTIVTAADIPGENTIVHLAKDHPCLASERINHQAEPILLLAHPDKSALHAAVAAVHIAYQELPGVFTIEDSEAGAAGDESRVIWHGDDPAHHSPNTFKTFLMQNTSPTDREAAFAAADFIVEGEYRTGAQEQLYIENNGVIAEAFRAPDGTLEAVTVSGSMQCPYYLVHALSLVLGLPQEKCRVIQTETGGAFGGKEDFPSVIGSHAALLAIKSGHSVKICYDRAEDLIATTKRHPSRTRHRTAVSRDGKILAGEIDIALDGGAYATLSPVVLSRATIHAPGPYLWPHIAVNARAMATNTAPHGAFRGFGAPQSLFALERHMDKIARVLGLTPEEVPPPQLPLHRRPHRHRPTPRRARRHAAPPHPRPRRIRLPRQARRVRPLQRGVPGGLARWGGQSHLDRQTRHRLRRLHARLRLHRLRRAPPQLHRPDRTHTRRPPAPPRLFHRIRPGNQHHPLPGLRPDPPHPLRRSPRRPARHRHCPQLRPHRRQPHRHDRRQAGRTSLRIPPHHPCLSSRSAPLLSSRSEAEGSASCATIDPSYTPADFRAAALAYLRDHGSLIAEARYQAPPNIFWDDDLYRGDAYPAYAWAVYVAEVAVDTLTYAAEVTDFYALQEVGKVIHPILAKGQVEGGIAQGIGYALYEKCVYVDGLMRNGQMTNYIMPTSADLPPIHVYFEETPCIHGPGGAKGIGELPMDGPAPAILNAIEHATGISFTEIPLLPEDIFERMTRTPDSGSGSEDLNPAIDLDTPTETSEVSA